MSRGNDYNVSGLRHYRHFCGLSVAKSIAKDFLQLIGDGIAIELFEENRTVGLHQEHGRDGFSSPSSRNIDVPYRIGLQRNIDVPWSGRAATQY